MPYKAQRACGGIYVTIECPARFVQEMYFKKLLTKKVAVKILRPGVTILESVMPWDTQQTLTRTDKSTHWARHP